MSETVIACPECGTDMPDTVVGPCEGCAGNDRTFTFEQLDDKAKEKAREKFREHHLDHDWWDAVYDDAVECAKRLGIEIDTHPVKLMNGKMRDDPTIYFSGFWSQGDGASFEGSYRYRDDPVKAISDHAPQDDTLKRIAERLVVLQTAAKLTDGGHWSAHIRTTGRSNHSGSMHLDAVEMDEPVGDPVPSDDAIGAAEAELLDTFRDFADWIYEQLKAEYEYLTCDEVVDEQLRDYRFDEDGSII